MKLITQISGRTEWKSTHVSAHGSNLQTAWEIPSQKPHQRNPQAFLGDYVITQIPAPGTQPTQRTMAPFENVKGHMT
jgi:hypothetical protein